MSRRTVEIPVKKWEMIRFRLRIRCMNRYAQKNSGYDTVMHKLCFLILWKTPMPAKCISEKEVHNNTWIRLPHTSMLYNLSSMSILVDNFNNSLFSSYFPSNFKNADVIPVFLKKRSWKRWKLPPCKHSSGSIKSLWKV